MRILCVALAVASIAGCGWTPADEQVLTEFFEQSRAYDTTRLARVATVVFDPRTYGVVQQFRVLKRTTSSPPGDGDSRQLTIQADVRSAGGRVSQRTLIVTLERREGSWMVVGVE